MPKLETPDSLCSRLQFVKQTSPTHPEWRKRVGYQRLGRLLNKILNWISEVGIRKWMNRTRCAGPLMENDVPTLNGSGYLESLGLAVDWTVKCRWFNWFWEQVGQPCHDQLVDTTKVIRTAQLFQIRIWLDGEERILWFRIFYKQERTYESDETPLKFSSPSI